jgi:hypothetical protein
MLMERRTIEDLEAVLAERLAVIRERRSLGQAMADEHSASDRPARRSA